MPKYKFSTTSGSRQKQAYRDDDIVVRYGGKNFNKFHIFIREGVRLDNEESIGLLRRKLKEVFNDKQVCLRFILPTEELIACADDGLSRGLARFDARRGPLGYCLSLWIQKTISENLRREWRWTKVRASVTDIESVALTETVEDVEDALTMEKLVKTISKLGGKVVFPFIWQMVSEGISLNQVARREGKPYARAKQAYEREVALIRRELQINVG